MALGKIFSCGAMRVVPREQDSLILPARVANHSAGFDSTCPLAVQGIRMVKDGEYKHRLQSTNLKN